MRETDELKLELLSYHNSEPRVYRGTAEQIVEAMRDSFLANPGPTALHYMEGVAQRCQIFSGAKIATSGPAAFVTSLCEQGFLVLLRAGNTNTPAGNAYRRQRRSRAFTALLRAARNEKPYKPPFEPTDMLDPMGLARNR